MQTQHIDALAADRRAHAGASQVDTSPIPLPHGHLATFQPPSPDDTRLGVTVQHTDAAAGRGCLFILDHPAAASFMERLLSFITPAQPGGMAAPSGHPWLDLLQEHQRQQHVLCVSQQANDDCIWGELAAAAGCYAVAGMLGQDERTALRLRQVPDAWPFEPGEWAPTTAREDLVKAGAFILAELARLDRLDGRSSGL